MATSRTKATDPPPEPTPPAWYEATEDLYIGGNAGTMRVAAFRAGDQVPADLVAPNGWTEFVKVPGVFADAAPLAADDEGQADDHTNSDASVAPETTSGEAAAESEPS